MTKSLPLTEEQAELIDTAFDAALDSPYLDPEFLEEWAEFLLTQIDSLPPNR